jgi:hypothetical protein
MLPNKHFAKYKIVEWFFAEKSCEMHYTHFFLVAVAHFISGGWSPAAWLYISVSS